MQKKLCFHEWSAGLPRKFSGTYRGGKAAATLCVCSAHQCLKSATVTCRCHKCILAARSDYFRAFLERSTAQPHTHTSLNPPSQSSDASQMACRPHDPHLDPLSDPSDDSPTKVDPASIATGGGHTEHAAYQPFSCAQPYNSHSNTRQQHVRSDDDTSRAANTSQHQPSSTEHSADSSGRQLPQLIVSNVSPEVFQLVLEFAYSGFLQVLPPRWLKAAGAELLFEAAQRYLMPLLKVFSPCYIALSVLLHALHLL